MTSIFSSHSQQESDLVFYAVGYVFWQMFDLFWTCLSVELKQVNTYLCKSVI